MNEKRDVAMIPGVESGRITLKSHREGWGGFERAVSTIDNPVSGSK